MKFLTANVAPPPFHSANLPAGKVLLQTLLSPETHRHRRFATICKEIAVYFKRRRNQTTLMNTVSMAKPILLGEHDSSMPPIPYYLL